LKGSFSKPLPPPSLWVAAREIFQKSNKKIIQHLYMCTLIIWGLFTIWHQTIFHQELENLRIFHKPNELTRIRRSDENGREETGNCLQFLLKFLLFPTHTKKKISNSDHNNHRVYKYIIQFFVISISHYTRSREMLLYKGVSRSVIDFFSSTSLTLFLKRKFRVEKRTSPN
jgi:hypothetical protein